MGRGRTLMHVVEVRRNGDGLAGPMAEMREWLDNKHIEPTLFRLSLIPGGIQLAKKSQKGLNSITGSIDRLAGSHSLPW